MTTDLEISAKRQSEFPTSDNRWSFICSYNTSSNRHYKQVRDYGHDSDLKVVPADAIRALAAKQASCALR
jgi:hypothetical protein